MKRMAEILMDVRGLGYGELGPGELEVNVQ